MTGLRVRLAGVPGNPGGIGARIRLKFGERFGPAREVHAGAGYWSQDSLVQVLATPELPTAVWVRWPGGRVTAVKLPAGACDISLAMLAAHAEGVQLILLPPADLEQRFDLVPDHLASEENEKVGLRLVREDNSAVELAGRRIMHQETPMAVKLVISKCCTSPTGP